MVQLVDTRRSERRARTGLGVRLSPWSLESQAKMLSHNDNFTGASDSSNETPAAVQAGQVPDSLSYGGEPGSLPGSAIACIRDQP